MHFISTMTKGEIHDAGFALMQVIQRPRNIPQTAKFRIAKLQQALSTYYQAIEEQRNALVLELGSEQFSDEAKTISRGWGIPPNSPAFTEYEKRWDAIRAESVTITHPLPVITAQSLGDAPDGIEAAEFCLLGPLIVDSTPAFVEGSVVKPGAVVELKSGQVVETTS